MDKLDELRCPRCERTHTLKTVSTETGLISCTECHSDFDTRCDVPVLVPPGLDARTVETIETFAAKWSYDPAAMREERTRIANAWFMKRFGFVSKLSEQLSDSDGFEVKEELNSYLAGKTRILDAGCGLGNLTTLLAQNAPHADVWGVDLSVAVHYVQRASNIHLVQGDITNLPIEGHFGLIVSDGVLHHTPDTRASMLSLSKRLAPGGDFLFYVYKEKAPIREFSDDYIRGLVSNMRPEHAMNVCRQFADLGRQLREAHVKIDITQPIDVLGIPAGVYDLHRFIYWYFAKFFWDDGGNDTASMLENFDWYHPSYAWRHTESEVRGWVAEAGLELIRFDVSDSGFSVWARRIGS